LWKACRLLCQWLEQDLNCGGMGRAQLPSFCHELPQLFFATISLGLVGTSPPVTLLNSWRASGTYKTEENLWAARALSRSQMAELTEPRQSRPQAHTLVHFSQFTSRAARSKPLNLLGMVQFWLLLLLLMMMMLLVWCQRPWPELENKIQIMFKVGMGNLPKIPENLSLEGQEFLGHCLQINSDDRWTASQLKGLLFVSVSK